MKLLLLFFLIGIFPARADDKVKVLFLGDSQSHAGDVNFATLLHAALARDPRLELYFYAKPSSSPVTWVKKPLANTLGSITILPDPKNPGHDLRTEVEWQHPSTFPILAATKKYPAPGLLDKTDFDFVIVQTGDNEYPWGMMQQGNLAAGLPILSAWSPAWTQKVKSDFRAMYELLSTYRRGERAPRKIFWITPPQEPSKVTAIFAPPKDNRRDFSGQGDPEREKKMRGLTDDPDYEKKMADLIEAAVDEDNSYVFRSIDYPSLRYANFAGNEKWAAVFTEFGGTHHCREEDEEWVALTAPAIEEFLHSQSPSVEALERK